MARQNLQHDRQESGNPGSTGQPKRLPDRLSVRRLFLMLIEQMVRHRPLAFWSAVWLVPLLLAIVSVTALMMPEYAAQKPLSPLPPPLSPAPTATHSVPPVQPVSSTTTTAIVSANRRDVLPLWSLGAIVLTCTAGSVFVSRRLTRTQTHPRLAPTATRTVKRSQSLPIAVRKSEATVSPAPAAPPAAQPTTAVVPSSESHPLDWSEDSLADLMDIRKRRSLSSWL